MQEALQLEVQPAGPVVPLLAVLQAASHVVSTI